MATNLYETLGLSKGATPEQIRKAYRRRALDTHPDRLPEGASPADKVYSEDMFRKVNNAYEVLSDPENRKFYDQYGVWPPLTHESYAQGNWKGPNRDPFDHPFLNPPFSRDPFFGFFGSPRHPHFKGFTDPFVLFNHIFGDLHRAYSYDDPFGHWDDFFSRGLISPMSLLQIGNFPFGFPTGGNTNIYISSSHGRLGNGPNGSEWITQSYSASTVKGVKHAKAVRRDSEGNEHVAYSYANGNERRLINGVKQPSHGSYLPPPQRIARAISPPPPPPSPPLPLLLPPPLQHNGYPIAKPPSLHLNLPGYSPKQQAYGGKGQAHDQEGGSLSKFSQ